MAPILGTFLKYEVVFFLKNIDMHQPDCAVLQWKCHNLTCSLLTQLQSQTLNLIFDAINLCIGPVIVKQSKNFTFT